jgi:hypothetical protein
MAKLSKTQVRGKASVVPTVRFEEQSLTSFAGLVVFQQLFARLELKHRLWRCFRHLAGSAVYGHHVIVMLLVVHLLLGYRELRDARYYRDDEMVKRLLGLKCLPDVATMSRALASADERSVEGVRAESRRLVLERLGALGLARVTADFDGTVLSTGRHAQGTAVGFNKQKKGRRSYYPLLCTVAQTGQVLDVHHRPGNVHDSNGASAFISQCLGEIRDTLPGAQLETRMDSAFFSEEIVDALAGAGVQFTASVPFERFAVLKHLVESRRRWRRIDEELSYFESQWKPNSWSARYRFLFIRKRVHRQHKEPLQLELFVPHELGYDFKVIVTNKRLSARKVVAFHEGRGAQEGVFAELKTHCQLGHVPVTTRVGNQLYLFAAILAHNLGRELQMLSHPPERRTTAQRATLWAFQKLDTLRRNIIQRAGRLVRPNGNLVLSMNHNPAVEAEMLHYLNALQAA